MSNPPNSLVKRYNVLAKDDIPVEANPVASRQEVILATDYDRDIKVLEAVIQRTSELYHFYADELKKYAEISEQATMKALMEQISALETERIDWRGANTEQTTVIAELEVENHRLDMDAETYKARMDELQARLTTAETLLSRWLEGCENGRSWSPISDTRAFLTSTQEADNGSK